MDISTSEVRISASEFFSSSILSITDCFSSRSPLDKITKDILEIMNKAAITAVDLVKK